MITTIFIKKLNNTELGKGGTHDCYILVPVDLDLLDIFNAPDNEIDFEDKDSKQKYPIRLQEYTNETRIPGFGNYYRDKSLEAGDEIVLRKVSNHGKVKFELSVNKFENCIVLSKRKYGFIVLNENRIQLIDDSVMFNGERIELKFAERRKARSDSPEETNYYNLLVGGMNIGNQYAHNDVIEIVVNGVDSYIARPCLWKKYIISSEDQ